MVGAEYRLCSWTEKSKIKNIFRWNSIYSLTSIHVYPYMDIFHQYIDEKVEFFEKNYFWRHVFCVHSLHSLHSRWSWMDALWVYCGEYILVTFVYSSHWSLSSRECMLYLCIVLLRTASRGTLEFNVFIRQIEECWLDECVEVNSLDYFCYEWAIHRSIVQ